MLRADAVHELWPERAAARLLALRPGSAGAADLHRRRSPISARNGRPAMSTRIAGLYYAGIELRRILRPVRHRRSSPICRLARLVRRYRAADACRRRFVALALPRERRFVRSRGSSPLARQMLAHLRDRRLLAIYAVGFGVLFNFTAIFTYVNFHLAAPPYLFPPTLLGAIFVTYLAGSLLVPWIGRGSRCSAAAASSSASLRSGSPALASAPRFAGHHHHRRPALCAACGLLCQAVSTSYVITTAKEGRSSAVGLYALDLLYRRQRRRVPRRPRLERGRLERLRRHDRHHASDRGDDRCLRLGTLARVMWRSTRYRRAPAFCRNRRA